jgi:phosphatidylglycerophosphate synthase
MQALAETMNVNFPSFVRTRPWHDSAVVGVFACAWGLAFAAAGARHGLELDAGYLSKVLAAFAVGGGAVALLAHARADGARFGLANQVTLARAALIALLIGLLGEPIGFGQAWYALGVATVAACLDCVDGKVARRRGEVSRFGARFDMETDALLIAVLSLLVWQLGKAGAWILLAGAMRYLFVGAACLVSWLERPLPHSRRRQTVCVVQVVALIVCLAPIIGPAVGKVTAFASLALLLASFGIDVAWLAQRRH